MNPPLLSLPVIDCQGTARELGRAQGEAKRSEIRAFSRQRLEALREYLAERGQGDLSGFVELGRRCLALAARWDAESGAEHAGIAEGAAIDAGELYAVANMTDVRDVLLMSRAPDTEGCSAFALPAALSREGALMAGQTWDLNPRDLDYVVAVHRKPTSGIETWSLTCVGCLSIIGMNAEGVAIGTTNIKTRRARIGVAYQSLVHRALACRTRAEAEQALSAAPRAAAHTYWIADGRGAVELECDADGAARRELQTAPLVRTNHCLHSDFRAREAEEPNASSLARFLRLSEVLGAGGHDISSLQALFRDRARGVLSINRYPEDAQGTTTNACTLMVPARREFWACRGPADRGEWRRLCFESNGGVSPELR